MNIAKVSKTFGLVALTAVATSFAAPYAMADQSPWYVGGSVGQANSKFDNAQITKSVLGSAFTANAINGDDTDTGFKLFAGYHLNKYFALEGGYFDLGRYGFTANTTPLGTLNGNVKVRGLNMDLVGTLPITDKFSAIARVGVTRAKTSDSFIGTGAVFVPNQNPSIHDTNYKAGLGLQYAFSDALMVRTEIERYRLNDAVGHHANVDHISVGLTYRFGQKSPTPVARVVEPAPAYVPPAPAPVVVAAAPAPAPVPLMKVSFSADSVFDFDKAAIKPAGKEALDKFSADVRGTNYSVINVTGNTDRIGSPQYNMKLSTERANSVKSYLETSGGIPAGKISATGVGESNPVTKAEDCKGNGATKKLIACLQADRRVDVEVSGTK